MRPVISSTKQDDSSTEEESVEADSEDEMPAKDSPKEFDEQEVVFGGKKAWVVSVSCA